MADDSSRKTAPVTAKPTSTASERKMESHLGDEKNGMPASFVGATLEIGAGERDLPEVRFSETGLARSDSVPSSGTGGGGGGGLDRNRPGSTAGKKSTVSTGSKTAVSPSIIVTDHAKDLFFSKKPGTFERGVEWCQGNVLKSDLDGQLRGAWLLGEIDHWDHEREKMLLITDNSLLIVNYDFITAKLKSYKRIAFHLIHTIQVGDFVYPEKSLMGKFKVRDHGGIRITWGNIDTLSFGQKWNPFASDIPQATFIHHPLIYNRSETETVTYNVDDFCESLEQAVRRTLKQLAPEQEFMLKNEPLMVESYASVSSLIFNQSHLGFNRDRNGLSF